MRAALNLSSPTEAGDTADISALFDQLLAENVSSSSASSAPVIMGNSTSPDSGAAQKQTPQSYSALSQSFLQTLVTANRPPAAPAQAAASPARPIPAQTPAASFPRVAALVPNPTWPPKAGAAPQGAAQTQITNTKQLLSIISPASQAASTAAKSASTLPAATLPAPSATVPVPAQPDIAAKQAKPDVVMDAKSFARLAPFIMPTLAAKQAAIPATPASDPSDTYLNSIEQLASKALAASQPRTNTAKAPSISVFDAIEGMRAAILPDRDDIVRPSASDLVVATEQSFANLITQNDAQSSNADQTASQPPISQIAATNTQQTSASQSDVVIQAVLTKQSTPQSSDTKTTTPDLAPQFAAQIFVPAFAEPQAAKQTPQPMAQTPDKTRVDTKRVQQTTQAAAPKQAIAQAPTSGIKAAIQAIAAKPFTRQPIQTVLETLTEAVASSNDAEQATPATPAAPAAANIPKSPQLTAQTSVQKFNDALAAKQIVAPVIASMLGDQASLSTVASRAAQAAAQTLGKTPSNAKPQTSSPTPASTTSQNRYRSAIKCCERRER